LIVFLKLLESNWVTGDEDEYRPSTGLASRATNKAGRATAGAMLIAIERWNGWLGLLAVECDFNPDQIGDIRQFHCW
jgi:hypothetical protein